MAMKKWKRWCMALAVAAGATPGLQAQVPATAPPAAAAAVPAQTAGSGQTLWKFLGLSKDNLASCKTKFCQSQLGQMMNNGMKPFSSLTGGLVPGCCPLVNPADLAKPADSAEGAAARIKQDEAAAKARREAVRYLGTVDCRFWPEAQDGLINALRTDRNECVRLEAALALGRGCCCNKKTIKALSISVAGTDEDGNPAENSERVKAAAAAALQNCLAYVEVTPIPEKIPEQPREAPPQREGATTRALSGGAEPLLSQQLDAGEPAGTAYYKNLRGTPMNEVTVRARQTLANSRAATHQTGPTYNAKDGLLGIIKSSVSPSSKEAGAVQPVINPSALSVAATANNNTGASSRSRAEQKQPTAEGSDLRTVSNNCGTPPPHQFTAASAQRDVCCESHKCGPYGGVLSKFVSPRTRQECVGPRETIQPVSTYRTEQPASVQPSNVNRPENRTSSSLSGADSAQKPPRNKFEGDRRGLTTAQYSPPQTVAHSGRVRSEDAPVKSTLAETMKHMAVLRNSIYPEEREQAANYLGRVDWRTHPQVVQALLTAACEDQTPRVRATCIRCLAHMNANTQPVINTLMQLRNDHDIRIQQESMEALARLTGSQLIPADRKTGARNVTSAR